jgi:hypothetical protein
MKTEVLGDSTGTAAAAVALPASHSQLVASTPKATSLFFDACATALKAHENAQRHRQLLVTVGGGSVKQ